jgi:GAF domain-containing protein
MEVSERVLGADQGSVMLLDGRGKLKIVSSRGIGDDVASKVQLKLGERVAGLAALEKTEFLLNGTLDNYPLFKNLEGNPIIRSSMICPISHQDKVLGILNLSRTKREDAFTSQDLTRATLLAKQIGAALHYGQVCMMLRENAQQFKTMYRLYRQSREELSEIEKMSPVTVPFLKKPRLSA